MDEVGLEAAVEEAAVDALEVESGLVADGDVDVVKPEEAALELETALELRTVLELGADELGAGLEVDDEDAGNDESD